MRRRATLSGLYCSDASRNSSPKSSASLQTPGFLVAAICSNPPAPRMLARTNCRITPSRVSCGPAQTPLGCTLPVALYVVSPRETLRSGRSAAWPQVRKTSRPRVRRRDRGVQIPHMSLIAKHLADVCARPLERQPDQVNLQSFDGLGACGADNKTHTPGPAQRV